MEIVSNLWALQVGRQTYAQADTVKVVLVVLDVRELLSNVSAGSKEHAVGELPIVGDTVNSMVGQNISSSPT